MLLSDKRLTKLFNKRRVSRVTKKIKSRGNNAHSFCKCGRLEKFEGIVPLRLLYDRSLPQSEVRYCFRK